MSDGCNAKTLWQEQEWQEIPIDHPHMKRYAGMYRVVIEDLLREFPGMIDHTSIPGKSTDDVAIDPYNRFDVYMKDRPPECGDHSQGRCIQLFNDKGWFKVHYNKPPDSVDAAILHLQNILFEALTGKTGEDETH